jgi:hypothetical protein
VHDRDDGFSLLELTIALGLTLAVTTAVATMVQPARGAFAALPEGADMQQRLRVGVDTLTRDLMLAGAGAYVAGHSGPLSDVFAPVMPFRRGAVESDPVGTFRSDTITSISVPATAAQTTLAADLTSGSLTLHLAPAAGCPAGVNLCGFVPGMTVLAFDDTGAFDVLTIATVLDAASQIAIAAWPAGSSSSYKAGTPLVEAQVHTYSLKSDPVTRNSQLMRGDGSGNPEVPVVDHVVRLAFEYYDESRTPIGGGPARPGRHVLHQRRDGDIRERVDAGSGDPLSGIAAQPESESVMRTAVILILRARCALRSTALSRREDGVAMVMALMAIGLLTSLGLALLLASSSEVIMAGHFRDQRAALYAAEAIVARAMSDVAAAPDWTMLIDGAARSTFVDGPAGGTRTLQDGTALDLVKVVNLANCQKSSACAASDLTAVTAQRPWGVNNPRWQLYAYGPLRDMLSPGAVDSPWYVVLLVGDDPLAADDVIAMRAEAYGPTSAHTVVELTAARITANSDYNVGVGPSAVRILSWREVR